MQAIPITDPNDPAFVRRMAAEMAQISHLGLIYTALPPLDAYVLIAVLQLAWRHPGLVERQRSIIESFARQLSDLFHGYPHLVASLEMGWRRDLDVPAAAMEGAPSETS